MEAKGPGSKRKQQEAKVQEFLRGPGAPEGPPVPLEVRLRNPGEKITPHVTPPVTLKASGPRVLTPAPRGP